MRHSTPSPSQTGSAGRTSHTKVNTSDLETKLQSCGGASLWQSLNTLIHPYLLTVLYVGRIRAWEHSILRTVSYDLVFPETRVVSGRYCLEYTIVMRLVVEQGYIYLQYMSIELYTSSHAGSEIAYHAEVVEEFDTLDRDEELEFHFALPTIELLQLVGSIADGLQTIQLLHLCKTIPLTVRGREK